MYFLLISGKLRMWKHKNIGKDTVIEIQKASSKPVIRLDIVKAPVAREWAGTTRQI